MQIDNRLIQKETIYFTNNGFKLSDVNYEAVKEAVDSHSMVGFLTGYYDERLTISSVSGFFLKIWAINMKSLWRLLQVRLKIFFLAKIRAF